MSFIKKNNLRFRLSSVHNFIYEGEQNILKDQINNDIDLLNKLNTDYGQLDQAKWEESYSILKQEFFNEMKGVKHVAILLTGGMDSRIGASLLNEYSLKNKKIKVTAFTWGSANSRDVVYSKRICETFKWDFVHVELTLKTFMNSVDLSIKSEASISPLHFHGVGTISSQLKEISVDKIIAGSYGDSFGRGEYSGNHIKNAPKIVDLSYSKWSPLFSKAEKNELENAIYNQFKLSDISNPDLINEMSFQYCYMGMMLSPIFDCFKPFAPVYQIMTSDSFRYHMLKHKREIRTDDFYFHILKNMNPNLSNVPWARTGVSFGSTSDNSSDKYSSVYYEYPSFMRSLFSSKIIMNLQNVNFLTKVYYYMLFSFWSFFETKKVTFFDEFFSILFVLSELSKENNDFTITKDHLKVTNPLTPFIYIIVKWLKEKL